jgi:hypothetical protein
LKHKNKQALKTFLPTAAHLYRVQIAHIIHSLWQPSRIEANQIVNFQSDFGGQKESPLRPCKAQHHTIKDPCKGNFLLIFFLYNKRFWWIIFQSPATQSLFHRQFLIDWLKLKIYPDSLNILQELISNACKSANNAGVN